MTHAALETTGAVGVHVEPCVDPDVLLRQVSRMEAAVHLASGIGHDLNNVLTVITCCSQMLLDMVDREQRPFVEEVLRAGSRAIELTQELLHFSHQEAAEPRILDLNAIVSRMEATLRRMAGDNVGIVVVLGDIDHVRMDPARIEALLSNLVANARDAMPCGGALIIETSATRRMDENGMPTVVLSVSDAGPGMDEASRTRAFERFSTTKPMSIALATVRAIVAESGGSIGVESAPGQGSTFRVTLPAQSKSTT